MLAVDARRNSLGYLPSVRDDNVVEWRVSTPKTGEADLDDHGLL